MWKSRWIVNTSSLSEKSCRELSRWISVIRCLFLCILINPLPPISPYISPSSECKHWVIWVECLPNSLFVTDFFLKSQKEAFYFNLNVSFLSFIILIFKILRDYLIPSYILFFNQAQYYIGTTELWFFFLYSWQDLLFKNLVHFILLLFILLIISDFYISSSS